MKKLIVSVIAAMFAGIAFAAPPETEPPQEVIDYVTDRVAGEWSISCSGNRTDGANPGQDWALEKNQMNYVNYGVLSHTLINFMNNSYLDGANETFQNMGIDTRLQIVE